MCASTKEDIDPLRYLYKRKRGFTYDLRGYINYLNKNDFLAT